MSLDYTVLGVSNISFGLPNRELLNSSFLTLAMQMGLDLPIINPNVASMMDAVRAYRVLYNIDVGADEYIAHLPVKQRRKACQARGRRAYACGSGMPRGLCRRGKNALQRRLKTEQPLDVVNGYLIPALDVVGAEFEARESSFTTAFERGKRGAGRI